MPNEPTTRATRTWLVSYSGSTPGMMVEVGDGTTRVGRGPQNDLVMQGPEAANVSLQHLEIVRDGDSIRIRDLGSTNGTYVNGEPVTEAELSAPAKIRFGSMGPELMFTAEDPGKGQFDRTLQITEPILPPMPIPVVSPVSHSETYEGLLARAVARARHARSRGLHGQTMTIMRETLHHALRRTHRRLHWTIGVLAAGLIAMAGLSAWKIATLDKEKGTIDQRIQDTEAKLEKTSGDLEQSDRLIEELTKYQTQAEQLQRSVFYRFRGHEKEDFLTQEIRALMAEFGAEAYSVPPDFATRVQHYVEQYQGPNRSLVAHVLTDSAPQLKTMQNILKQEQLPPDLAFIPLVESALAPNESSSAGARGPWQFTPATARNFGLRVDKNVDERTDLVKSTRASAKYLRELLLDFGAGSSVMLALAAYNSGQARVKNAVMNTVKDPIKQRNFWYLYRVNALPNETREYVPRVVAAMVIGRNPHRFGF